MLASCTSSQFVYFIGTANTGDSTGHGGNSPSEACRKLAIAQGQSFAGSTVHQCSITGTTAVFPVIQACEPLAKSPFVMPLADGVQLSALILSVWVSAAIARWVVAAVRERSDES